MKKEANIFIPKWNNETRLHLLMAILNNKITFKDAHKQFGVPIRTLQAWIKNLSPNTTINPKNKVLIWKDKNLRYKCFNQVAATLGTKNKPEIGLTDYDITPERAHMYREIDEQALHTNQCVYAADSILIDKIEWMQANVIVNPIKDHNDEPIGVFSVGCLDINFASESFDKIFNILINGYANLIVKEDKYHANINNNKVTYSNKEVIVLLYSLIGQSSKQIARNTHLSLRTIEDYIYRIKEKSGASTIHQVLSILWQNKFFHQL